MRSQEVLIDRGLVLNTLQLNLQIIEITITVHLSRFYTYQVDLISLLGVYGAVEPL